MLGEPAQRQARVAERIGAAAFGDDDAVAQHADRLLRRVEVGPVVPGVRREVLAADVEPRARPEAVAQDALEQLREVVADEQLQRVLPGEGPDPRDQVRDAARRKKTG